MKIYTRAGDRGMTTLIGGRQVPKSHDRIDAYGSVDELIAFIGLLRDIVENSEKKKFLMDIQDRLMTAASLLAADTEEFLKTLPQLREQDIKSLENEIDHMNEDLTPIHSFVLPGGHPLVSICHIARTVCRRAERNVVRINPQIDPNELIIQYLNRLSDFLFVFSRLISKELNVLEVPWRQGL